MAKIKTPSFDYYLDSISTLCLSGSLEPLGQMIVSLLWNISESRPELNEFPIIISEHENAIVSACKSGDTRQVSQSVCAILRKIIRSFSKNRIDNEDDTFVELSNAIPPASSQCNTGYWLAGKKRYGDNSQMTAHQSALRDICKSEDLKQMPIAEILSCERVVKVLTDYEPLTGSSADLHSLVLFLRWKYTSQRKGSVELEEILKNVSECGGKLNRDTIEQAVWLFGFYCGFDKLAGDYYARTPDTHVLVKTQIKDDPCVVPDIVTTPSEPPIAIEKVKKTRKPRTSRKKAASDNQPQLLDTNPLKSARPDGPVPSNA